MRAPAVRCLPQLLEQLDLRLSEDNEEDFEGLDRLDGDVLTKQRAVNADPTADVVLQLLPQLSVGRIAAAMKWAAAMDWQPASRARFLQGAAQYVTSEVRPEAMPAVVPMFHADWCNSSPTHCTVGCITLCACKPC